MVTFTRFLDHYIVLKIYCFWYPSHDWIAEMQNVLFAKKKDKFWDFMSSECFQDAVSIEHKLEKSRNWIWIILQCTPTSCRFDGENIQPTWTWRSGWQLIASNSWSELLGVEEHQLQWFRSFAAPQWRNCIHSSSWLQLWIDGEDEVFTSLEGREPAELLSFQTLIDD